MKPTKPANTEDTPSDLGLRTSDSAARATDLGPRTSDSRLRTRPSSLFLASSNPGKLLEFREAAALRNVTVQPLPGFAQLPVCIEDGTTFEENARKKAIHYSRDFSGSVFADDSGICVDALDGAPGIYSARFAGPEATDQQNNEKLLADLHQVEALRCAQALQPPIQHRLFNRAAHYICVIALAQAGQVITAVEGRVDGVIIDEPRGASGFGYDPYFSYPPLGKTLAEISPEEKFAVSHRGAAFRKLLDFLSTFK
jgi:XTP/dITP diphosphohydrolase